jgi:hypothetical protein
VAPAGTGLTVPPLVREAGLWCACPSVGAGEAVESAAGGDVDSSVDGSGVTTTMPLLGTDVGKINGECHGNCFFVASASSEGGVPLQPRARALA